MRQPIIAGNWKMHKTIKEAIELVNNLKRELTDIDGVGIIVCPVYTALAEVGDTLINSNIALGAQNLYWEASGAFTGEISADMIKDVGCKYVIVGHSERRKYFSETDEMINKKIRAALTAGLIPIFCLGETLQERETGEAILVIKRQLKGGLKDLSKEDIAKLIIAYEPVWAIGTGKTAAPHQAQEIHKFIRKWLRDNFGPQTAEDLSILYGGSVNPSNAKELTQEPDIDGALVGGASLEAGSFAEIIKNSIAI